MPGFCVAGAYVVIKHFLIASNREAMSSVSYVPNLQSWWNLSLIQTERGGAKDTDDVNTGLHVFAYGAGEIEQRVIQTTSCPSEDPSWFQDLLTATPPTCTYNNIHIKHTINTKRNSWKVV